MTDASHSLLVISDAVVRACVPVSGALSLVEAAFAAEAEGKARTFPVVVDFLSEQKATVFDSTGCSFQDHVVAGHFLKVAEERGLAGRVNL